MITDRLCGFKIKGDPNMTKLISKFALLILIIAILFLLISGNLLSTSPFVIAGQLLAIALSIWARRSFLDGQFSIHAQPVGRPLLSTGPYQYIRHPMYSAALLFVWVSILGHLSISTVIIGFIVTCIIFVRIRIEEQLLRGSYPNYADYSLKTKRIFPYLV
jgi:protein-S-isoprenylcysteine O-methyltransferase Ste14